MDISNLHTAQRSVPKPWAVCFPQEHEGSGKGNFGTELFGEEVDGCGCEARQLRRGSRTRQKQMPEQAQCAALGRAQGQGTFGWGAWPKQQGKLGTENSSPVT